MIKRCMHKINYIANSMEEFNYAEEAYKEFIKIII